jgi:adenylate cyclase
MAAELTFVFADLAGYTALTEAHGDDDAAHIATRFHDLSRACLPVGAQLVKTIGDAVMLVATNEQAGIEAAIAVARAIADEPSFPALRVGLHAGPAVERDGDYFGATVNIAARVAAFARGGEIVCTERIAAIAAERGLAAARAMGTVRLKNVAHALALYELNSHERGHELRHVDPVCRMQVSPAEAAAQLEHDGVTLYFCSKGCAERFAQAPDVHLPTV